MFEFEVPYTFLLLPLPFLVYFLFPRTERKSTAIRVPFYDRAIEASAASSGTGSGSRHIIRVFFFSFIWLCLVCAAARPQITGEAIPVQNEGRDLMLAVDISDSMKNRDMYIQGRFFDRLTIVKYILNEFLEKREGDRVGLILYGSNAYLQAPLTFDLPTISQYVSESTFGLAGEQTAIGEAIGLAVKRLKDRPASQRVLILLTDGSNTAGNITPRQAADLAAQAEVKIYSIGLIRSRRVDEETLEYIANTTGGQYFRAREPQELQSIYAELDALEKIELDESYYRPIKSLYPIPLAIALCLSVLFYSLYFVRGFSIRGNNRV